ncbi:MAG: LrgB family protein [Treponema sp.]|jgi:putative effector of murein hydrolase|nr:LrgB family protein [Treponema sp.]
MTETMAELFSLPVFGIILTVFCFYLGVQTRRLLPHPLVNPLFVANIYLILFFVLTPLTLPQYMRGGTIIQLFIVPATTILALKIYRQRRLLFANVIPIAAGCLAGSVVSIGSVLLLCKLFNIEEVLRISLLPKSVTTAIALELSEQNGGLRGLTVTAVIVTGMTSCVLAPFLIKVFRLKDPVAAGIAMGASGHAIATSAALELGETEGAMSGLAMALMGIITSVIFAVFI